MQLLHNRYIEVLVDHKAIEYMIKSKMASPTTRLKTLLLHRLLIPIYDLQKKAKKFKWTDEAKKAFNKIKKLLISPPVLKAPTPDDLLCLESDTSREGVGGTLLQKQGDEWVVIGYHSKRLPKSAKNFGIT